MPTLPPNPNLDQLRHQAKELLGAAKSGDPDATRRLQDVSERPSTLAVAQLAIAREYGFPSWVRLKEEVETRALDLAQKADAFCEASISGRPGRALRLLAETPELATFNLATAVILGDIDRVRELLGRDPSGATRVDPRTGWTALHAACASRWHQLEPARADALRAVAELLIAAGADPTATTERRVGWTPLRCVIASANSGPSNRAIVELLLAEGAVPNDHDLYLAGFAHDRRELLALLLDQVPDVRAIAEQALAAPVSNHDTAAARVLLEAGADPNRYRDDDGTPMPAVWAAIKGGCPNDFVELLLAHDADPNAPGLDGRTPYRLATTLARSDLTELLAGHGAGVQATPVDQFLYACLRADRAEARRLIDADPGLLAQLDENDRTTLIRAAETGNNDAVALMLELGFPLETRGENGATALHTAAYSGGADTVRLLLDRAADIEARDTTWDSTPLDWAIVGSGEHPATNPHADWVETVRTLLERGASVEGITASPDDPKPPSAEVAALFHAYTSTSPR